jgi:hypothetical protein
MLKGAERVRTPLRRSIGSVYSEKSVNPRVFGERTKVADMDDTGRDGGSPLEPARIGAGAVKGKPDAAGGGLAPRAASPPSLEQRVTSLSAALRRARIDNAAQSSVLADLRGAEIARLEILREQLDPVLAQLPRNCDLFDVAVSPGERPRLFIDQIGFVELGRDRRTYRFLQDTRHGRINICENDRPETMVEAITAYIAHRLIEREKALANDFASGGAGAAGAATAAARAQTAGPGRAAQSDFSVQAWRIFLFFVELVGSVTFFGLLAMLGLWLYRNFK